MSRRTRKPKPNPATIDEWVRQAPAANVTRQEFATILKSVVESMIEARERPKTEPTIQ